MRTLLIPVLLIAIAGPAMAGMSAARQAVYEGRARRICDPSKKTPDQFLEERGITAKNFDKICAKNDEVHPNNACTGNAQRLLEMGYKWVKAHEAVCQHVNNKGAGYQQAVTDTSNNQNAQSNVSGAAGNLRTLLKAERRAAREAIDQMKKIRQNVTEETAQPIAEDLQKAEIAQGPGDPKIQAEMQWQNTSAESVKAQNNQESAAQAFQAIQAIQQMQNQALSTITSPYLKEPLAVAAAATDLQKELEKRDAELAKEEAAADRVAKTTGSRSNNMGTMNGESSGSPQASTSGDGDLAKSDSDLSSSGGGLGGLASAAGGAAGGLGGYSSGSGRGGLGSQGSGLDLPSSSSNDPSSSTASNGMVKTSGFINAIQNNIGAQKAADAGAGKTGSTVSTGASQAAGAAGRAGSLRNRLRQSLSEAASADASEGGLAATSGGQEGSSAAKSNALRAAMLKDGGEADGFSNPPAAEGQMFPLAGSETDSAVRGLVSEFESTSEGSRDIASVDSDEQEGPLPGEESPSLFKRMRETLERSQLRGLVTFQTTKPRSI